MGKITDEGDGLVELSDDVKPMRPEEFVDGLRRVIDEINTGLAAPRWSLDWDKPTMRVELMAAAALRHCEVLTTEMLLACDRQAQYTVRLLGRSMLEAWLSGMYLHYGGADALLAIIGNFEATVRATQKAADEFDKQLAERVKDATRRNVKIDKANAGIECWNEGHRDTPRPLIPRTVVPTDVPLSLELRSAIAEFEIEDPKKLGVYETVDRIRKVTEAMGREESYESMYQYGYRSLSYSGAHPTSNVLASYIEGWTYKTVGTASALRDSNEAVQATTLLLLAHMVESLFERRGVDHAYSNLVVRRFDAARLRAPHSTRSDVLGASASMD